VTRWPPATTSAPNSRACSRRWTRHDRPTVFKHRVRDGSTAERAHSICLMAGNRSADDTTTTATPPTKWNSTRCARTGSGPGDPPPDHRTRHGEVGRGRPGRHGGQWRSSSRWRPARSRTGSPRTSPRRSPRSAGCGAVRVELDVMSGEQRQALQSKLRGGRVERGDPVRPAPARSPASTRSPRARAGGASPR